MRNRKRGYQHDFSKLHHDSLYNRAERERKARTMVAVLGDFLDNNLHDLSLLDVGASTGIVANFLAEHFEKVTGIDIDREAIQFARRSFVRKNIRFVLADAINLSFRDEEFDVIICAQVYEHVPVASRLISEMYRVLKPGGVCYFAAGNRLNVNEGHYHLPFLSIIPKPLSHLYLRLAGKGTFYYEKHLSYWGLQKLVSAFKVNDYTKKIVNNPGMFHAEYMIEYGRLKRLLATGVLEFAYWLSPSYIWLLEKT